MIQSGLFTSLLPTAAVFTHLSNYRKQIDALIHLRSAGNFRLTDLSLKVLGPYLFDIHWYEEYFFCGVQISNHLCLLPVSDMFVCKTGTTITLNNVW